MMTPASRVGGARKYQRVRRGYGRRGQMMLSRRTGLVRRVGQEVNFVDTAVISYNMNTTGTIALLATIAQGAAQTQRIGRKILLKSIQVRGVVTADSTTLTTKGTWFIVYDKRPTGSLPAITDILVTANSRSMTNSVNVGRFQIICRKDYSIVGNNTTAGQQDSKCHYSVEKFIKLNKRMTFKDAGTGVIGDIEQGALYIVSVGDVAAGTADAAAVLGFRTRYYDI